MKRNTYSDLLKDPRWQRKRLEIMQRDDFTCVICGDKESTLNVHHREYIAGRKPWEYENEDLITVCEDCHELITKGEKVIKKKKWEDDTICYLTTSKSCLNIYIKEENTLNKLITLAKSTLLLALENIENTENINQHI